MAAGAGTAWAAREWYDTVDEAEAEQAVGPSVVTVLATSCAGTGRATGLVIREDRVLTVASAITGPMSVVVVTPSGTVRRAVATAAGTDGLAILQVPRLGIVPARLADRGPRNRSDLALLGRTDTGDPQSTIVSTGTAGGLTTTVNKASYGGPLVDARNRVAGLVLTGSTIIDRTALSRYAGLVPPVTKLNRGSCAEAKGPQEEITPVFEGSRTPLAEAARLTLTRYVLAVNRHDFKAVRATYTGKLLDQSVEDIAKQHRTTYFIDPVIRSVQVFGESGAKVQMTLVSIHAEDGPAAKAGRLTCARWDLSYNLTRDGATLKILGSAPNDQILGCDS